MTSLRAVVADDLRVIVCLAFDHHAPEAEVTKFKGCLIECEHVLHAVEATGAFDLIIEARVASLADYNERLGILKTAVGHLLKRYEANFVCRRFVQEDGEDKAIWVPCEAGKARVDYKAIDMVSAEGDYMRVHCAGTCHLVHMTMHTMAAKLGEGFVLVHRSKLIRCDFIDRLLHRGHKWIARLKDGSHVAIAKSHVGDVMGKLNIVPAKIEAVSSKDEAVIEKSVSDPSKSTSDVQQRELVMSPPSNLRAEGEDIMQRGKSLSMIAAVALTGSGLLATFPADAKPRNGDTETVYGRFDPDIPRRVVSYRDLNLATLAGEKTLNRRVGGAVRIVCSESVPDGDFYQEMLCDKHAWGGARPQIALAVMRARQIASTGTSAILPVAITLSAFPK